MKIFLLLTLLCSSSFASKVVICNPGDPIVQGRVIRFLPSAHTPNFEGNPNILVNPDLSALVGVSQKNWKCTGTPFDAVIEMTQVEKDAIATSIVAVQVQSNRDDPLADVDAISGEGVRDRALIELFNKRDNYVINRLLEIQQALDAMKATGGGVQNVRNAIPASWLATNTRTKSNAVQAYKDDINAGNQDNP